MSYGKSICKQLKAIRRQIAEENSIPLEIPTCTYQGECAGTCPQCESEVRFLERELAKRLTLGKAATVAGIAVTLSAPASAQVNTIDTADNNHSISCQNKPTQHDYSKPTQGVIPDKTEVSDIVAQIADHVGTIRGTIYDMKTNEPVPFAPVVIFCGNTMFAQTMSDFDGLYTLKHVPTTDSVRIATNASGYKPFRNSIKVKKQGFTICNIALAKDSSSNTSSEQTTIISGAVNIRVDDITPSEAIGGINVPAFPNFHPASEGATLNRPCIKIKVPYENDTEPHIDPNKTPQKR